LALHLADGETATLTIVRKGYRPKTVTVKSGEPKQTFVLEAAGVAVRPVGVVAKPAAAAPLGGIDDVGDPFAKKH
jgi:hypothetical protein